MNVVAAVVLPSVYEIILPLVRTLLKLPPDDLHRSLLDVSFCRLGDAGHRVLFPGFFVARFPVLALVSWSPSGVCGDVNKLRFGVG